jgi:hypothetical protein
MNAFQAVMLTINGCVRSVNSFAPAEGRLPQTANPRSDDVIQIARPSLENAECSSASDVMEVLKALERTNSEGRDLGEISAELCAPPTQTGLNAVGGAALSQSTPRFGMLVIYGAWAATAEDPQRPHAPGSKRASRWLARSTRPS